MNANDKHTLSRLWDAVRRNLGNYPDDSFLYEYMARAWFDHLRETAEQPIPGEVEVAAHTLKRLEAALIDADMTVTYERPKACPCGKCASKKTELATGMLMPATRTMFIEPGHPTRMLYTMLHETAHAFILVSGAVEAMSDSGQEVVADAVACLVLSRLGFDPLPHCAAYITPYVVEDHYHPDSYDDLIIGIADTIEGKLCE